jgi:sec-independent protein translocase protein TatB
VFDVGFSEILIIAVVALLVLGPERLPKAARFAGLWVRRARAQWASVRAELERELEIERVRTDLDAASASLRAPVRELQSALREAAAAATAGTGEVAADGHRAADPDPGAPPRDPADAP